MILLEPLATCLAAFGLFALGSAVKRILQRDESPSFLHLGESFFIGLCSAGLILYPILAWNRFMPGWAWWVLTAAEILAIISTAWWLLKPGAFQEWTVDARSLRAPALIFGMVVLTVLWAPLTTCDAQSIYALKGRLLYEKVSLQSEYFTDPQIIHYHANYPMLWPLMEAHVFWLKGSTSDLGIALLSVASLLALAFVIVGNLQSIPGFHRLDWAFLSLLSVPMFLCPRDGGALSGYADVPFAGLALIACHRFGKWWQNPSWQQGALLGVCASGLLLLKQEGVVWIAAFVLSAIVVRLQAGRGAGGYRSLLMPASIIVVASALLALGRVGIMKSPYEEDYGRAMSGMWMSQVPVRGLQIIQGLFKELMQYRHWGMIWPMFAVSFFLPRAVPAIEKYLAGDRSRQLSLWTILFVFGAYESVFLVTPNHLGWHLWTAEARLLLHLVPIVIWLTWQNALCAGLFAQVEIGNVDEKPGPLEWRRSA